MGFYLTLKNIFSQSDATTPGRQQTKSNNNDIDNMEKMTENIIGKTSQRPTSPRTTTTRINTTKTTA